MAVVFKYFKWWRIEWFASTFDSLNVTLIIQLVVIFAHLSNFHLYCYWVYENCVILIVHVRIVVGIIFILLSLLLLNLIVGIRIIQSYNYYLMVFEASKSNVINNFM
jgi:hypothetical protein